MLNEGAGLGGNSGLNAVAALGVKSGLNEGAGLCGNSLLN